MPSLFPTNVLPATTAVPPVLCVTPDSLPEKVLFVTVTGPEPTRNIARNDRFAKSVRSTMIGPLLFVKMPDGSPVIATSRTASVPLV